MSAKDKSKNPPNFINEKGEVDFAKLLETNPNLLPSFVNKREDEGGSQGE